MYAPLVLKLVVSRVSYLVPGRQPNQYFEVSIYQAWPYFEAAGFCGHIYDSRKLRVATLEILDWRMANDQGLYIVDTPGYQIHGFRVEEFPPIERLDRLR